MITYSLFFGGPNTLSHHQSQCETILFYKQLDSSVSPLSIFVSIFLPCLMPQVQSLSFPQQKDKPVDLWSQDCQITHIALQGQMEGHSVQGNPKLPAIHPVHEGEDQDPAYEETQEDNDAIDSVQPGVIKAQLHIRGQEKEGT